MQTPCHVIILTTVMFALEPIKPLTIKLQTRIQDIYQGHKLVDETIDFIKSRRADIDDAFDQWYSQASSLLASVGVEEVTLPRRVEKQVMEAITQEILLKNILKEYCVSLSLTTLPISLRHGLTKKSRICAELLVLLPTVSASDNFFI